MARTASDQPTDGELEILSFLWDAGPAELRQICSALNERRKVATTTVATMLGVMLGKGLVTRNERERNYLWSAKVSREAAARGLLGKLVDRLFDGQAQRLVAHLIEDGQLTSEQRREIQEMLEESSHAKTRKRGPRK